ARLAAQAGAESRVLGLVGRGEEEDLAAIGSARRARGPAVDAGRAHRVDESPVGRRIARQDRLPLRAHVRLCCAAMMPTPPRLGASEASEVVCTRSPPRPAPSSTATTGLT